MANLTMVEAVLAFERGEEIQWERIRHYAYGATAEIWRTQTKESAWWPSRKYRTKPRVFMSGGFYHMRIEGEADVGMYCVHSDTFSVLNRCGKVFREGDNAFEVGSQITPELPDL